MAEDKGVKVILTRTGDQTLPLAGPVEMPLNN